MTYTDRFVSNSSLDPEEEENYLTAFGITFTPKVSGITCGILGLLAAFYVIFNWGIPAFDNYLKIKQLKQEKQEQIDFQKQRGTAQKFAQADRDLQQAKVAKAVVVSLFSNQQTIDTLLFDISNVASTSKIKLSSFQPKANETKTVDDGSLGQELNGKLKQQSIDLVMTGSFEDTEKFLRDLERLQPLLLVSNINVSLDPKELVGKVYVNQVNKTAKVVPGAPKQLNTSFTLKVIFPLSAEELTKFADQKQEKK